MSESIPEMLTRFGVIPVIAIENAEAAVPLADALIAGGLPVAEITFRTVAAADVMRALRRERPGVLVGAGTVLAVEQLDLAKECGARFAVAPGTNPAVVTRAAEIGLPFIPGVATPTDIELAMALGCQHLKFFPAEACGGTAMLSALSAPYRHTGVRFVPTGGVKPANLVDYLRIDTVMAVGGTWIATKEDIAGGRWTEIRARCEDACRRVKEVR